MTHNPSPYSLKLQYYEMESYLSSLSFIKSQPTCDDTAEVLFYKWYPFGFYVEVRFQVYKDNPNLFTSNLVCLSVEKYFGCNEDGAPQLRDIFDTNFHATSKISLRMYAFAYLFDVILHTQPYTSLLSLKQKNNFDACLQLQGREVSIFDEYFLSQVPSAEARDTLRETHKSRKKKRGSV